MNLITDFEEINRSTLSKSDKTTIAVITKFNDDSRYTMQYAIEMFGMEARYVLVSIYSIENALVERSDFPTNTRARMTEKLLNELKLVSHLLPEKQPEILIDFAFGSTRQVIERRWNDGQYNVVAISSKMLGWFGSVPSKRVPILIVPPKK